MFFYIFRHLLFVYLFKILEDKVLGGEVEVPGSHLPRVQVDGHHVPLVHPDHRYYIGWLLIMGCATTGCSPSVSKLHGKSWVHLDVNKYLEEVY